MTTVIDRRASNKNRLAGSRKKFIERYKSYIRNRIAHHIRNKKIKDIKSDIEINVNSESIEEVKAKYSKTNSKRPAVHAGNKTYNRGDKIRFREEESLRKGGAGNSKELSNDDFKFILTKEEFLDILFEDMELPNFLKKSDKVMTKKAFINGGYTKNGIPARLAIKKTLENALARRIASGKKETARFLDDIDLRFRNLIPEPKPISTAVIFMLMDVSGSMTEFRKLLAKKFFLLFYLFLQKHYKHIEIRFIAHTVDAFEVTEEEFFYSTVTGGTTISPSINLINHIIDTEYKIEETNFYMAQASDGDNWGYDFPSLYNELEILLPKLQYGAYIEVDNFNPELGVYVFYKEHFGDRENFALQLLEEENDVFNVLRELFKKGD